MSIHPHNGQTRAAQYLRMSSENQIYSTENQQNAIAEYAGQHGYAVVASYIDAGKSGLSLTGRDALKQLLSDALATPRAFDVILVLDVSRWGRFQNPDQAGHYEFLCRQAGVRVVYCGEPFGDDVAPITTIVKHLKRVMASEYSRELSAKLSRAHRQQALLGFRQGGGLLYGFRRLLVDAKRNPRQFLKRGEYKALSNDKVVVVPGPAEELEVIRRIFRLYVRDKLSIYEIARRLAKAGVKGHEGKALSETTIHRILASELCVGQMTYNVTSKLLQGRTVKNPESTWTRFRAFEPIVPPGQFRKAQERLAVGNRPWNKEAIIASLTRLLETKGHLSQRLLNSTKGAPSADTVDRHFGSLSAAYAAVGYDPTTRMFFGNNGRYWTEIAVITGLQQLQATRGRISNRLIELCPDLPCPRHIRLRFGSLANALRKAGLPAPNHSEIQRDGWKRRKDGGGDDYIHGVHWSNAELLQALRCLHDKHGYVTQNLLDWDKDTPGAYYFVKRFGSLTQAKALAKLPLETHSQMMLAACQRAREGKTIGRQRRHPSQRPNLGYRTDDLLLGLKRLVDREGAISARLINDDPELPWSATVAHHFGKLSKAYRLLGLVRLKGKRARFGLRQS
ncbi:recombinase family protein [Bradyrhizobium acaciae]|uniref:recombinase family protein n=1 Tax=Bradyrhizobium acaciae TaxID=2683706 RepID=UPI001E323612|nr:recombinase family protein [Bradyrhizobium acaciae]MCC8977584.1 recombinase family protein [Bradyrhizobium acaciae]